MFNKILSVFLLIGSIGVGHASEDQSSSSATSDQGRTWDDGTPMSDKQWDHIRDVYLGGD